MFYALFPRVVRYDESRRLKINLTGVLNGATLVLACFKLLGADLSWGTVASPILLGVSAASILVLLGAVSMLLAYQEGRTVRLSFRGRQLREFRRNSNGE